MIRRYLILLMIAVVAFSGSSVRTVVAIDRGFYSSNGIDVFDPDDTACQSTPALVAGDTTSTVYSFLSGKGFTGRQSAAVIGNLKQESGLNPKALNSSSGAYGIAQWLGDRKNRLLAKSYYTANESDSKKELQTQLDFLWEELETSEKASFDALKSATTTDVGELAVIFGEAFERYGEGEEGKRAEYAEQVFQQYGDVPAGDCRGVGAGDFVFYEQDDPRWANYAYGAAGTLGPAGCGPTSMAMIVATLANKNVTPKDTADLGAANGSAFEGGTIHLPLIKSSAEKWGLTYRDISAEPIENVARVLEDGGLVYMGGQGPAPFTSGGHIVVIRGVTPDGQYIVGDPYRNAADVYSPNVLEAYRGATFAITKE